jgi:ATP-binding cassette, subfamily B, bacterial MsbA
MRRVLRLARAERRSAALMGALGIAAALFEGVGLSFIIPLAGYVMDGRLETDLPVIGPILSWLNGVVGLSGPHIALLVVGFFCLGVAVNYVNFTLSNTVATRFADDLRRRVFEVALTQPLPALENLPSGRFFNVLASETWRVCDALLVLVKAFIEVIFCAVLLAFLFMLSPFNTVVLLVMTAAMGLAVHLATRVMRRMGAAAVQANEALMGYVWDAVGGLRVIRGFGREDYERRRFADASLKVRDVFIRMGYISNAVNPITQLGALATIAAVVGVALARGEQLGTLLGFLAIAYRMQPRVSSVLNAQTALKGVHASVLSVHRLLAQARPPVVTGAEPFAALEREIVLENVSVRYPGLAGRALHDVSCRFARGRITALVGPSGAGKSTLVALLQRFVDPEAGCILIDGRPLAEIDPVAWHRRIALIEQGAFFFNASVGENIAYGDLGAGQDAIRAAARMAQAHDFIMQLPDGYDTLIGERGVGLSQGQRQRLALARALIGDPDILILDEATNALDSITEQAFQETLAGLAGHCTVIIVAHRFSTIEAADHILVLDGGRLVEQGDCRTLRARNGLFARLSRLQSPESANPVLPDRGRPPPGTPDPGQALAAGVSRPGT